MVDRLWYLKQCDLFKRLSAEQMQRLEERSRYRTFDPKSLIYLPSDQGDSVLLVASGRVKMYHITSEGKQSVIAFIDPGELFGELSLLETSQREEFAEAMEKTGVILIPGQEVLQLMQEHPVVSQELIRLMGLRRRTIERRLKSLLYRSPRDRMVHLLIELAEKYGRRSAEGVQLDIRLSHQEMSSVIGTTREMVTVMLGELRSQGLIEIKRRQIVLKDLNRLASAVDESPPALPVDAPVDAPIVRQAGMQS